VRTDEESMKIIV